VPDRRLETLAEINASQKIVHATMRFVDIAGLVRGASSGEGLGNAFLSHIRETDAVAMVVRCFDDPNVTHVEGSPDPLRDIEIIAIEMALADLATLARRREKLAREARANPKLAPQLAVVDRLVAALEANVPARSFGPDSAEMAVAREHRRGADRRARSDGRCRGRPRAGGEEPGHRLFRQDRIRVRRPYRR
jgi:ribosome-binding ATPase YchF (GTP1/OBG family)